MANNDLNQIRIFSKVAELHSFTKAADTLGIEKSTVSAKVSQLESRLGIRLLQRTTRSVNLTEAGSQYLSYCEQALAALQMGDDFVTGLKQEPSGKLRVLMPQNMADYIMSSVIIPFLQRYPKVNLELVQSNGKVDMIKDNFDIAIRATAQDIADSSLIYRKIYQSQRTLVASPAFIHQYGLVKNLQQLTKLPSIGTDNEHESVQYLNGNEQTLTFKHRFSVNSMNGIKQALLADLGFAVVAKSMVRRELNEKLLIELNNEIKLRPNVLYLIYPSRSGQPAKLKAFVDAMKKWGHGDRN